MVWESSKKFDKLYFEFFSEFVLVAINIITLISFIKNGGRKSSNHANPDLSQSIIIGVNFVNDEKMTV